MDDLLPYGKQSAVGLHSEDQHSPSLKSGAQRQLKKVLVLAETSRYLYGHQGGELSTPRCSSQLDELPSTETSVPTHRVCQQKKVIRAATCHFYETQMQNLRTFLSTDL